MDIINGLRRILSVLLKIVGGFLILVAVIGVYSLLTGGSTTSDIFINIIMFIMLLGIGVGGFFLFKKSIDITKRRKYNPVYTDLIMNSHLRSLQEIAMAVNRNVIDVERDIQLMINQGQFQNAYLDLTNHEIIFRTAEEIKQAQKAPESIQTEIVRCPGCGAKNTIQSHKKAVCEYCGMGLKKED